MDKSKFDLSNEVKTSFGMGKLVPFHWLDVVPGDRIRTDTRVWFRMMPLIAPIMHKVDFYVNYYYVPYRILQDNFEKMIIDPASPVDVDMLGDYYNNIEHKNAWQSDNLLRAFGIGNTGSSNLTMDQADLICAYPFLAYHLIHNYYYKDPLLDQSYVDDFHPEDFKKIDLLSLARVNWSNDYFTSIKPTTQYGSEVDIDMDGNNVVKVNELRTAEKLQRFKEKLLLSGNRYVDYIKSFFGTRPSDYSLQKPLHLGGTRHTLDIRDVDQTVGTDKNPLANVGGKVNDLFASNMNYQYDVTEHGIIMGLMYVKPRQSYIAGIPRMFLKRDFYDFAVPMFANLGMQEVSNVELDAANCSDPETFGYNERYAELKYGVDVVAGDFQTSLNYWHFGRDIRKELLSKEFLECRPSLRPFAIQQEEVVDTTLYYAKFRTNTSPQRELVIFGHEDCIKEYAAFLSSTGIYFVTVRPFENKYAYFSKVGGTNSYQLYMSDNKPSSNYRMIVDIPADKVYTYDVPAVQEFVNHMVFYIENVIDDDKYNRIAEIPQSFLSFFKRDITVSNACLALVYNKIDALRPLPKVYNPSLI